jgi:hypothetical protein
MVGPVMPDMGKIYEPFAEPVVVAYMFTDSLSGIAMNIAMIVAGVGLLRLRQWGRKMSLWVAGLKIVRLVLLSVVTVFAIAPTLGEGLGEAVEEMIANTPGAGGGQGPPPGMFAMVYGIMFSVMSVGMALFGVIYPAICLWLLRKPAIKAAFEPGAVNLPAAGTGMAAAGGAPADRAAP